MPYLSPLRGLFFFVFRFLGLTPQAMHMSLLRSSRAARPELWCGRLARTWSMIVGDVQAGRLHHKTPLTPSGRLKFQRIDCQETYEPRSGERYLAWGVSPRIRSSQKKTSRGLSRRSAMHEAGSGGRLSSWGISPSVWL